jgi:hypothetical protein
MVSTQAKLVLTARSLPAEARLAVEKPERDALVDATTCPLGASRSCPWQAISTSQAATEMARATGRASR